jgi:amino acid adenylation domain-containing protein
MAKLTLPEMVEAQARIAPDRPALMFGAETLSYCELNAKANRLAYHLVDHGVAPEQFIAVALALSPQLVIALLAVMKTGAAYLAIDLNYPAERIAFMLADARPRFLLTTGTIGERLPPGALASTPSILLDRPELSAEVRDRPAADLTDTDRAGPLSMLSPMYLIYTSGSTGAPKGVVVEHRAAADYLTWSGHSYRSTHGVAVVPTSPAFDLTVTGLYTPLTVGGRVRLLRLDAYDSRDTDPLLADPSTFLKVTPSHLPMLATMPAQVMPLEEMMLGGEALTGEMIEKLRQQHPGLTVINSYGITETTVNCAEYRIRPGDIVSPGPIPIGQAHENTRFHVLDPALAPVTPGATGELYIAGARLARGYLRQAGATAGKFIADPFGPPGQRMYRTGDLVRCRPDGNLVFAGRADGQVKLRGHRVELTEVESELARHPGVAQAACTVRETPAGPRLEAYVTATSERPVSASAVRKFARDRLPGHMVPAIVVIVDALPLTANAKLDRQALASYSPELSR